IFKYFYEELMDSLLVLELDASLTRRDRFMMQIALHIEKMTENTNLIKMLMQEQMVHISKELDEYLHFIHQDGLVWFKRKITELYPELPTIFLPDCTIMLDSLFKGYMGILIRNKQAFNVELLPIFLSNRMDSIIESLQKTDGPLLKQFPLPECLPNMVDAKEEIILIINRLMEIEIKKEDGQGQNKDLEALKVLHEEFAKVKPSGIIVEGLLLLLEKNENRNILCSKLMLLMKDYLTTN
ncbi:MAG: hypothetical protein ABWX61_07765, partial [Paenisporosarcina sp.]